jgi:hypothetical protein
LREQEIHLLTGVPRHYASVWRDDPTHEAVGLHGLSAEAHLARCRELAAQGYRPVALSLAPIAGEKGPLAASVWHRPVPPALEQERLARRQGTAAATLLHLKQPERVWPLLRHSPDPTVRSFLVERVGSRGIDPAVLVRRLEQEKDASVRRALIVALGGYSDKDLPAAVRGPLVKKLLGWYRDDPDAGIHGAIDWLLRHGKEGPLDRPLDWTQAKELERIDKELSGKPGAQARKAIGSAQDRTWPAGQKRPNDLGVFEMHGNVWTWCQEVAVLYGSGRIEDKEDLREVEDRFSRVLRGASFYNLAPTVRSASRYIIRPGFRGNHFGVRPCRTWP